MGDAVSFIRKNGKIIPIRAAQGAGHASRAGKILRGAKAATAVGASVGLAKGALAKKKGHSDVAVNKKYDAAGFALSVGSGIIAAATFGLGVKGFAAGAVASHGLDALGVAANVASVRGKGNLRGRAEQGAKQEARNLVIGNAVFGAGLLASSKNRARLVSWTQKAVALAKKSLIR